MKLYLDRQKLLDVARTNRARYATAEPFPHCVLDGLFPEEALDGVLAEFPGPQSPVWKEYENYHEGKLETQGEGKICVFTSLLLYQFNSAPFLQFLEELTGIKNLIADPYFYGGGLHQIPRGGKLGIHADFSRHGTLPLDRRLNVLIYLNRDWKDEYGGHLELWAADMSRCVRKVLPTYNRTVVFNITDWAYHGHPEALACREGMTRKSIALYYFQGVEYHVAAAGQGLASASRCQVDRQEGDAADPRRLGTVPDREALSAARSRIYPQPARTRDRGRARARSRPQERTTSRTRRPDRQPAGSSTNLVHPASRLRGSTLMRCSS